MYKILLQFLYNNNNNNNNKSQNNYNEEEEEEEEKHTKPKIKIKLQQINKQHGHGFCNNKYNNYYQYLYMWSTLSLYLFYLIGIVNGSVNYFDQLCHPACNCLDTYFQCTSLPNNLPNWITKLNISNIDGSSNIEAQSLSRLIDLDTLYLDGNNFTIIPNTIISSLQSLNYLSLSRNNLIEFHPASLNPSIKHLDLSKNLIHIIIPSNTTTNNTFQSNQQQHSSTSQLNTLNLGSNLLESLHPSSFIGLTSLTELILAKNRLRSLPKGIFLSLPSLVRLDLSRNRLESLDSIQFSGLTKLHELNLKRNHLNSLSDGVFYGLESLTSLALDFNRLRLIERRWLYGLKSLTSLSLAHNELIRIEDEPWEYIEALATLDLSFNQLQALNAKSLIGLNALQGLHLGHNGIEGWELDTFASLYALQWLDLGANALSWIIEDGQNPFKGLIELKSLNLGGNGIGGLRDDAFKGLRGLKWLNLSSNPITWWNSAPFTTTNKLEIQLGNVESLICDCEAGWLQTHLLHMNRIQHARLRHGNNNNKGNNNNSNKQWGGAVGMGMGMLTNGGGAGVNSVLCSHPTPLAGIPLIDVSANQLQCNPYLEKPKFLLHPKSQIFLLEGSGFLECIVQTLSNHSIDIAWRKNYKELPTNLLASIKTSKSIITAPSSASDPSLALQYLKITSILELSNISWSDSGSYSCLVSSPTFGPSAHIYSSPANITIHSLPSFIKTPSNLTVRLGSNAKLECAAIGFPLPEIAFAKDGGEDFPAALDRRFHVMPNDDSFFIMEVKLVDGGIYSCSASNSAGVIVSYAAVVVYETPSFVTRMRDESSVEGSNALLECLGSGSPRPSIQWSKDGVVLQENESGGKYVFSDNGTYLVVKNVRMEDEGKYECVLVNAVGSAKGSSTLSIISASSILNHGGHRGQVGGGMLDNGAMTIIFIIIAVFCVVGTSAAWVVVIYRTRQRNTTGINKSHNNNTANMPTSESIPLTSGFGNGGGGGGGRFDELGLVTVPTAATAQQAQLFYPVTMATNKKGGGGGGRQVLNSGSIKLIGEEELFAIATAQSVGENEGVGLNGGGGSVGVGGNSSNASECSKDSGTGDEPSSIDLNLHPNPNANHHNNTTTTDKEKQELNKRGGGEGGNKGGKGGDIEHGCLSTFGTRVHSPLRLSTYNSLDRRNSNNNNGDLILPTMSKSGPNNILLNNASCSSSSSSSSPPSLAINMIPVVTEVHHHHPIKPTPNPKPNTTNPTTNSNNSNSNREEESNKGKSHARMNSGTSSISNHSTNNKQQLQLINNEPSNNSNKTNNNSRDRECSGLLSNISLPIPVSIPIPPTLLTNNTNTNTNDTKTNTINNVMKNEELLVSPTNTITTTV